MSVDAMGWYAGELTQDDFVPANPYKTRVRRSAHGRLPKNWMVESEFWQIQLVYQTWPAAMMAARSLADTGKVSTFQLVGAQRTPAF